MDAIAADQTVQARADRFGGGNGFDQNPDLNHVASLPVVGGGFKSGRDDHAIAIFVENESVQREPPSEMGTMERSNLVGTGFPSQYRACALYLCPPT
jgi:hypothetical protein